jgi:hypothetical protein
MDGCFILKIYCLTLKDTDCKLVNSFFSSDFTNHPFSKLKSIQNSTWHRDCLLGLKLQRNFITTVTMS